MMWDFWTKEKRNIEICEVDYMEQYQFCHLFNRFAELATKNAQHLGLWNESMMNKYGWVVVKQSLHLNKPIYYKDRIELSTTVSNGTFVSFPRYYFIKKDDEQIGYCSSIWTLLDIQKRKIISPKRIGICVPEITHHIFLEAPKRIEMDIPMKYIETRQVRYSDVDINQHMNNTRYIQWAFDIIDYQIHQHYFVEDITIEYKKEIRPLENVELYLGNQDLRYIIEGRNKEEVYFTIEICFLER